LNDGEELELKEIKPFNLNNCCFLSKDTFYALQIFNEEIHPSMHLSKKQGLSLFAILNHTKTSLGQKLLRTWFLFPSLDESILAERLDSVDFLSRQLNLCDQLTTCLKNIKNIPRILVALKRKPKSSDWQGLIKFAYHALKIKNLFLEHHESLPSKLVQIFDSLNVDDLRDIGNEHMQDWMIFYPLWL
jgi:DNA mismatch repair protein MSH5